MSLDPLQPPALGEKRDSPRAHIPRGPSRRSDARTTPRSQVSSWLEFTQVSCPGFGRGRSGEEQGGNYCAVKHLSFNRMPAPAKLPEQLHEPIKPHLSEIYRSLLRKSQTLSRPADRGLLGEYLRVLTARRGTNPRIDTSETYMRQSVIVVPSSIAVIGSLRVLRHKSFVRIAFRCFSFESH